MHINNKEIMSRPYWITINRGWSFGFVIQKRNIFDKMFIFNVDELDEEYKNDGFKSKNIDLYKNQNLDNYFGMILQYIFKLEPRDLFFYFNMFPYWNNAKNVDQPFIDVENTEAFCKNNNIIGL